jgi:hypothetical protein
MEGERKLFCAVVALLIALVAAETASARQRTDCHAEAIHNLQRFSLRGYAIYAAMADKKQFLTWVTCDDIQLGLTTGVHESVHMLTEERDAFPLIEGGEISRRHAVSKFFAPREIAARFDRNDIYVQGYLRPGGASSASDFMFLLDELNAFSHDLHSAVRLVPLQRRDRQVDHRDGLAALMIFVMSYVDAAQKKHPATWQGLLHPETKRLVQTLWTQAEGALASSCGVPAFGRKDREYVAFMCEQKNGDALAEVLGRAPVCPRACLSAAAAPSR